MKYLNTLLFLVLTVTVSFSQQTYNNLPVVNAKSAKADYRINDDWTRNTWTISPQANPDVLSVPCVYKQNTFAFYTDIDSISFTITAAKTKQFYVKTGDGKYALTEIRGIAYKPVQYDHTAKKPTYEFWYSTKQNNEYLNRLRTQYHLDDLIKGLHTDSARALRIVNWCHNQWSHDGNNEPLKSDAISILEEAKGGKLFRCVEYGIVTTAALQAIGLPARVLGLKIKEVETTKSGAGHVLLEVYLTDMKKWVLLDGQWDVMPVLNNVPLNAIEFQHAISSNYDKLAIRSLSGTNKGEYTKWIFPYLYYLDVKFDNREGEANVKEMHDGKPNLMLVPTESKNPTIFQRKFPIDNMLYSHSISDFYATPSK